MSSYPKSIGPVSVPDIAPGPNRVDGLPCAADEHGFSYQGTQSRRDAVQEAVIVEAEDVVMGCGEGPVSLKPGEHR